MNAKQWQAIEQARQILELPDRATLAEIKRNYHRLSKRHHPDATGAADGGEMYRITAAYELLVQYCQEFAFPLRRDEAEAESGNALDPEEWWRSRFGQDPLWSGRPTRRR